MPWHTHTCISHRICISERRYCSHCAGDLTGPSCCLAVHCSPDEAVSWTVSLLQTIPAILHNQSALPVHLEPQAVADEGPPTPRQQAPDNSCQQYSSLQDLRHNASADCPATFADGEPQTSLHGHRCDQLKAAAEAVPWHDHGSLLGQLDDACVQSRVGGIVIVSLGVHSSTFLPQQLAGHHS